jgi:hypothetical protein
MIWDEKQKKPKGGVCRSKALIHFRYDVYVTENGCNPIKYEAHDIISAAWQEVQPA